MRNQFPKAIIFIAIIALVSGCAVPDSRLIGRWHSNRSLTVATLPHRNQLSPARRAVLDSIFGRLTLTYNRSYIDSELAPRGAEPPYLERIHYRVLASDADSVTVAFTDTSNSEETTKRVHFVGPNRYWIPLGYGGGREYFDRVNR